MQIRRLCASRCKSQKKDNEVCAGKWKALFGKDHFKMGNKVIPLDRNGKIYVAGHRGLVGSALVRRLKKDGFANIVTRTHAELDLTRQADVETFFAEEKPDYVILAAAKVGGIHANNTYPAEFIMENLQIICNVIDAAHKNKVKKLLFLGSSCIYPKECPQPIKEEYLLSDYLEQTNEAYALAKISGLKMCAYYKRQYGDNFISVMPCNLYGPEDNFELQNSHVLPALLRKFHEAKLRGDKTVTVWGSGTPLREFLHVDDLADACLFLMDHYEGEEFFNVGSGKEVTILELARLIQRITGFEGELIMDGSKPDGTMRKVVDFSRLQQLGWEPGIELEEGIRTTYEWFGAKYETGDFAQR